MGNTNSKDHSIGKISAMLASIVAMALLAFAFCGCSSNAKAATESDEASSGSSSSSAAFAPAKVKIDISADGYVAGESSPVFVGVTDEAGQSVYHAIDANAPQCFDIAAPGQYSVSFLSPINSDGSIYSADAKFTVLVADDATVSVTDANESEAKKAEGGSDAGKGAIEAEFGKIDADKVSKEDIDKLKADIEKAIENGDENVKQEKDRIDSLVDKNIEAAEKARSEAEAKAREDASNADNAGNASYDNGGGTENAANGDAPAHESSGGSGEPAAQQGGSSSDNGSGDGGEEITYDSLGHASIAHKHDWQPIEETSTYTTVVCNACGAEFDSVGSWNAHSNACAKAGDNNHGSYSAVQHIVTETVGYYCATCGAR